MTAPRALPWAMWALGAGYYCYGFFQRVAPAVMVDQMMAEFQVGAAIAGMLSGLYFYTYAPMQIPIGLLLDRFGPRRMLAVFAAFSCVGSALFASADSVTAAYVGRGLVGVGAAVTWVGALKLASLWFPADRFAMITGLTLAMGMAGAVGAQAPLAAAVASVGWRGTMWGAAVVAGLLALVLALFVRDGPNGRRSAAGAPSLLDGLRRVLALGQTWLLGLYSLTMAAPMLSFAGLWGVPFLMQVHGTSRAEAAFTTSAMLVSWGIGSPLTGWISDRMGRRKPALVAAAGLSLVFTIAALYLPGLPMLVRQGLLCLLGMASSGFVLSFATGRENVPVWASGAALGVINTASMSSGAIFQPLIGWLLDLRWEGMVIAGSRVYGADAWEMALATLPACQAVALVAALATRETWCRHPER
ncbi:MAG: MFS transporter [Alphaproteobacteria bacterium]|nr:MFS transporter [Alphaproteobacteria bacterium]